MAEEGGAGNSGLDVVLGGVKDGLMTPSWLPNPQLGHFRCGRLDSYRLDGLTYAPDQHGHKLPQHSKPSSRPARPRPTKQQGKWVTGGPGMQAVFLDSATNKKSCGTGVFLPQIRPDSQLLPSNRPACSPVLLPSRVVQALNLNVHDLGVQIRSSRKEMDDVNMKKKVADQKREEPIREPPRDFSDIEFSSPEIFLPKEWTY